jgi:O-antigen/teichoic acid export membrane protein
VFTIAQRLIGLVRAVMTCSWLDAEQLGRWDMAFGFLTLATPLAMLSSGVFGRYVDTARAQLKPFVRRVVLAVTALAALSTALLMGVRPWVSRLLFGEEEVSALVGWLVAALLTTIGFSTLVELLTGLRVQRYSSAIVFVQSSAFAVLSAALVVLWGGRAESLVAAYVVATAASLGLATFVVLRVGAASRRTLRRFRARDVGANPAFAVWLWPPTRSRTVQHGRPLSDSAHRTVEPSTPSADWPVSFCATRAGRVAQCRRAAQPCPYASAVTGERAS